MSVWTVDTWKVRPGKEDHFLGHCSALSPDKLVIFRDLLEQGMFWSPEEWESREALEAWREGNTFRSAEEQMQEDVSEHFTHLMEAVPGFSPRRTK